MIWNWIKKYWQFLVGGFITIIISLIARGVKEDSKLAAQKSKSEMKDKEAKAKTELQRALWEAKHFKSQVPLKKLRGWIAY